ncbi:hypothetical protein FC26_GL000895 [Paucilactobacillus vaccinostercus DSM 20634]|jgi:uncharacterized protein YqgQ|uniref:Cytosolic protein n=1 Tax=Paucilactobacillus vaccinostercus DSM 20634 TaxID=1423813 RepID=A0A0R2A443_9LACO|nr:YqgQ family protein [Paucilactobacillus vaccinostercus]KRM62161.1 hypothetical protein FC26_GL000895 [Paucilactobacillus vaccinostercus DSM 20634]RRG09830.1 MAG: DUF910 family protein [Lactobacillus sp.]
MKTLYDVQQLLKRFGVYVYVGKRKWDIELTALELDNLFKSGVIERDDYLKAKVVLRHEHHLEEQSEAKNGLKEDEQ